MNPTPLKTARNRVLLACAISLACLSAAEPALAQTGERSPAAARSGSAKDPLEGYNRGMFLVNGVIDHFLIKPVAEAYESVVPSPIRTGVGNVFGNIGDLWSAANLLLQGKPARAAEMTMRVSVNTVLGLGGVLDIATEAGLERQSEDFGQTLATWGVPSGAYLVLPLLGPSSLRDAAGLPLDRGFRNQLSPAEYPQRGWWIGLQLTDARADALPFTRSLDAVALDKYTFVRDAYLARRRSQVHDGNPPPQEEEDDAQPVSPAKR